MTLVAEKKRPLMSSARQDWRTPQGVLNRLRGIAPLGLDPCASPVRDEWFATENFSGGPESTDGLLASWTGLGLVYVNPPYGREVSRWVDKAIAEAAYAAEIAMLVASRPDTRWFRRVVESACAVLFVSGRLTFVGAPDPAPFPSALAYWGGRPAAFRAWFSDMGWFR